MNNITQAPCTHKPIPAFVQSRIQTNIYPSNLDAYSTHNVMFLSIAHSLTPHDHTDRHIVPYTWSFSTFAHPLPIDTTTPIRRRKRRRRKDARFVWVYGYVVCCGCLGVNWRITQSHGEVVNSMCKLYRLCSLLHACFCIPG